MKYFQRKSLKWVLGIFVGTSLFSVGIPHTFADSLSITVTPPLFQLTIGPGESWSSSLKIVNNNASEVTYYAQVMDMQPSGEEGRSKFIPIVGGIEDPQQQSFALAHWIHVTSAPTTVPAGSSRDLPFSIEIPPNAEPGGHYAAILVGTQPGGLHASGTMLKVSSYVSSLFFVRIKGAVSESGRIREFLTSQQLYQTPNADFLLRFENTGNTHVRPQGDIAIYNMWGRERGRVLINQNSDSTFGNVLPKSIRRFEFSWEGDQDPFDFGLYSAVVTLSFGENGKQNVTSKTYFWVVPIVPVAIGIGSIILFLLSLVWFIRRYIRRALLLEQTRQRMRHTTASPNTSLVATFMEPVRVGVVDLRSMASTKPPSSVPVASELESGPGSQSIQQLVKKYRLFLIFLFIIVFGCIGVWLYFDKVLVGKRGFQITDVHIQAENVK